MSERLVTPGVYVNENDMTYIPQGAPAVGAAFIGPCVKGPAFIPTLVQNGSDFVKTFGANSPDYYMPYAAQAYLKYANAATVVRVMHDEGYTLDKKHVIAIASQQGDQLLALVVPATESICGTGYYCGLSGTDWGGFSLFVTQSGGHQLASYSCSLYPNSGSYITNVLGESPNNGKLLYVQTIFHDYIKWMSDTGIGPAEGVENINDSGWFNGSSLVNLNYTDYNYRHASTPWVLSQKYGSNTYYDLFKFHTLSDGTNSNREVKVGISNIVEANSSQGRDYGTFQVLVRQWDDTDKSPVVLENYTGVTLDPTSKSYIGRVIGNKYQQWEDDGDGGKKLQSYGDYDNKSAYIRVEVADSIENASAPQTAIPFGFQRATGPVTGSLFNLEATGSIKRNQNDPISGESKPNLVFFGWDYSKQDAIAYLAPLPERPWNGPAADGTLVKDVQFNLEDMVYSGSAKITPTSATDVKYKKFMLPFQGGFDGVNPARQKNTGAAIIATNTMGFDCSTATSDGTSQFRLAIDAISNPRLFNINTLFIPGVTIQHHSKVTDYAIDMVESREDVFYIPDLARKGTTPGDAVNYAATADTSYASVYYPWIKIEDAQNNRFVWAPPSIAAASALAFSDKYSYEWYAFAGMNRGVTGAIETEFKLKTKQEESLYEGKVNPIISYYDTGTLIWGQKTLQNKASALDRVNVRRLLINIQKYIRSNCRGLVFDQNTSELRTRLNNILAPYFDDIKSKNGIENVFIQIDENNNTPDIIARHIIKAELWLKPAEAAEYIVVDMNLTDSGFSS